MTDKLLPCPFCGGEAKLYSIGTGSPHYGHYHQVVCQGCLTASGAYWSGEQSAIDAWNARVERMCYADEVMHRDCKYSVNRGWKERTCKQEESGWSTEGDHARVWLTCGHDCMVPTVQDLPTYCPNCGAKVVG